MDIIRKYPGRFSACHIKDRDTAGDMTSAGDGTIDFKTLLPLAQADGVERFYIEHDNPTDALASVRRSYAYLTS